MSEMFTPLILTFKLAFCTSVILIIIGIPVAYFIAYSRGFIKSVLATCISMPLVLPPTVLGFYLLLLLSPQYLTGHLIFSVFHAKLLFTFEGLVIGSVICSFPFMVNPLVNGFESIPKSLIEAAETLGKSRLQTLIHVILPNTKNALLTGSIMSFAHTIGEFGVVLMIGGKISGETKVASIAVYDEVEAFNYSTAHFYAAVLFVLSFIVLFVVNFINRRYTKLL